MNLEMKSSATRSNQGDKMTVTEEKLPAVTFSSRAYASLLSEVLDEIATETGGVFLGYREGDTWHIVESVDPGPGSRFEVAYFEYDQNYINHLINKLSRIYERQLDLVGLWHRHPGSFDRFSATDDETNAKFASLNRWGAVSGLVNIDPEFRLTLYQVDCDPLRYTPLSYVVLKQEEDVRQAPYANASVRKEQIWYRANGEPSAPKLPFKLSAEKIGDIRESLKNSLEVADKQSVDQEKRQFITWSDVEYDEVLTALSEDTVAFEKLNTGFILRPNSQKSLSLAMGDSKTPVQNILDAIWPQANGYILCQIEDAFYVYRPASILTAMKGAVSNGVLL